MRRTMRQAIITTPGGTITVSVAERGVRLTLIARTGRGVGVTLSPAVARVMARELLRACAGELVTAYAGGPQASDWAVERGAPVTLAPADAEIMARELLRACALAESQASDCAVEREGGGADEGAPTEDGERPGPKPER
jgi:hypothetical protein